MAQIIPRGPSFGQELGAALGELAGLKLAQVVKKHRQEKEKSDFVQQFTPILGKDSANFLSNLSPEERRNALRDLENLTESFQQPGQQNGLQALRQQNQGFGQQAPKQQPNQQQQIQQAIKQHFGQPQPSQQQFGAEQPQQQIIEQQVQEEGPQITPAKAKLLRNIYETPQERALRKKQEFQERQVNLKETKPYIDNLKAQEKAAKESNLRLKRMENLIQKGNLPNAGLWSFLSKTEETPLVGASAGALLGSAIGTALLPGVGTAIGSALGGLVGGMTSSLAGAAKSYIKTGSPDIEEFEKLSTDFVKNAKQYFGSRITDADLRVFMQTIPTLMQTDEGKKKVINNLRSLNELAEIEAKAARSIIKSNSGIPPIDLEQQVKDKISDKIDKVAQEFIIR